MTNEPIKIYRIRMNKLVWAEATATEKLYIRTGPTSGEFDGWYNKRYNRAEHHEIDTSPKGAWQRHIRALEDRVEGAKGRLAIEQENLERARRVAQEYL